MIERERKTFGRFTTLLILLAMALWIWWSSEKIDSDREKEDITYPMLNNVHNSISGIIFSASNSSLRTGSTLIMLENNKAFSVSGLTYNRDYKVSDFNLFIKKQDSIHIPANTDSIYVIRNNKKYYFIHRKDINNNNRK